MAGKAPLMRRTALTALVAVMVVLAGCGATSQGLTTTSQSGQTGDALQPSSGTTSGPTGTLAFYVSDQPAAIEDFEHLNVTIEKVGLKPKAADDDEHETEADGEENETEDDDGETTTVTTTTTADSNSTTTTTDANATTTDANQTTTDATETTTTVTTTTEEEEAETESEEADEDENEGDEDSEAGWVTYEVDNRTVDLTELKGANATRLANLSAPSGTYQTVFVYVSEVNGTLKNGEQVNVKLPSQKLQLHTTFELGPNATTDFVYDIAVHKAGKSGKYILKPNIGESGTEVEIDDIDKKGKRDEMRDDEAEEMESEVDDANETSEANETDEEEMPEGEMDDHTESEGETGLEVDVLGNLTVGSEVTVEVTNADGNGVPGVTVHVNGDRVGVTNGDGQVRITVPDSEDIEVEVAKGDAEGEFEAQVEAET